MSLVKKFKSEEYGEITGIKIDEGVFFLATEISKVFGQHSFNEDDVRDAHSIDVLIYEEYHNNPNYSDLWADKNDKEDKIILSEGAIYGFNSNLSVTQNFKFKYWLNIEVIPKVLALKENIVDINSYKEPVAEINDLDSISDDEIMARALLIAQKTIESKNKEIELKDKEIEELRTKAVFADAISSSETSISVGEMAKILNQNGIKGGEKTLFKKLRENGYLIKKRGGSYNLPTQKSMNLGIMEIKESYISTATGNIIISKSPRITIKGQQYFVKKFLE